MTGKEFEKKISRFPKVDLISRPTPFYKLESLSRALKGPEIFIKRDDLTGLAFGGNKSRKLEFIVRDMLDQKCDAVVTWASIQSNWCLQTAVAARKYGIRPFLLLFAGQEEKPEFDGNLLLDFIADAEVVIRRAEKGKVIDRKTARAHLEDMVERIKSWGHRPYIAPIGGSMSGDSMRHPLGAVGYAEGFREMWEQARGAGVELTHVIHASGSGGTQAGLVAGARALADQVKIVGISVSESRDRFAGDIMKIVRDTEETLEFAERSSEEDLIVFDEYLQDGYGIVTGEVCRALRKLAVEEGLFLDPVYTGKAMMALIDLVEKGYFNSKDKIAFIHTGGTAALFPYRNEIIKYLE